MADASLTDIKQLIVGNYILHKVCIDHGMHVPVSCHVACVGTLVGSQDQPSTRRAVLSAVQPDLVQQGQGQPREGMAPSGHGR